MKKRQLKKLVKKIYDNPGYAPFGIVDRDLGGIILTGVRLPQRGYGMLEDLMERRGWVGFYFEAPGIFDYKITSSKKDMSKDCGFKDYEMHRAYDNREIMKEEFDKYFDTYCCKCIHMNEICMFAESILY